MPYAVTCKACGARFSVGDDLYRKRVAGKFVTIHCRTCRAPIRLDGAEAPSRRGSSRPPSATRAFPSRPPIPPGPGRVAPARLPSIQRTQLGGLSARGPAGPNPAGRAGAGAQAPAAARAPSPPRPRSSGNLPAVVPPAPRQLANAEQEEDATIPYGGFYDVSAEVESVPPSAAGVDLTDEAEALPPSVPLATQFARSRVPHPPKKGEPAQRESAAVSHHDDPEFLLGLRRGATEAPKAPDNETKASASAASKSSAAIAPPTPPPTPSAAALTPTPHTATVRAAEPAAVESRARTAEAGTAPAPKAELSPPVSPELSLSEKLRSPLLLEAPSAPIARKRSSSAVAVVALLLSSLGAFGVYRYLYADSAPAPVEEVPAPAAEVPAAKAERPASTPAEAAPNTGLPPTPSAPPEPAEAPPPPAATEPPLAKAPPPAPVLNSPKEAQTTAAPRPLPKAPAVQPSPQPAPVNPSPTRPPQSSGPSGPFDRAAAAASLAQAAAQASSCKKPGDPSGSTSVTVTFAPSGRVTSATLSGPPFAGTATGSCIASTLRRATVPPFDGDRTTVSKTVVIR